MYTKEMGDLLLTFSVPELYSGNNSYSAYDIDFDELIPKVLNELRFVLYVKDLPTWKAWWISRDEQNIDICDSDQNNKLRYETCRKLNRLPRKRSDKTYADQGSLIFHSSATRERAGRQLIMYNKSLQQSQKGNDLSKILHLPDDYDLLRIEEKTKGSPLDTNIKNILKNYEMPFGFTKLEIAFSKEYQIHHMRRMLSELGLDKKITTKAGLYTLIDNMDSLTKTTRKTCKLVVRFLNGEFKRISLCESTINHYRKKILETGYHYLYADADIPPVSIDEETGKCIVLHE